MRDKPHIGFVDTHAKSHSGDNNLQIVALEFFLHFGANLVFKPRVISASADPFALQTRGGVFNFCAAIAVNNAGFSALVLYVTHQLIERFKLLHQHVANIRAVKATDLN
ncbi:hypothetical protein D3C75_751790 [compost metagenome]